MMDNGFDPYDMLINLQDRLNRLEHAHNTMAHAYRKSEVDLNVALHSLRNLQQKHLELSQFVAECQLKR
jgi:hypothetical protein